MPLSVSSALRFLCVQRTPPSGPFGLLRRGICRHRHFRSRRFVLVRGHIRWLLREDCRDDDRRRQHSLAGRRQPDELFRQFAQELPCPHGNRRREASARKGHTRPNERRLSQDRRDHHRISERAEASNGNGGTATSSAVSGMRKSAARAFMGRIIPKFRANRPDRLAGERLAVVEPR